MEFLIKPRFRALNNALLFETDSLNALAREEYNDKLGFYQRQFGLYSYMRLTSDLTFRIHYPQGTPFMFQPHNNCSWTPTGTLDMATMEIAPCKAKINEQFCYDEFMDSTYKAFLQWGGRPNVSVSAAGVQANNNMIRTIVKNATYGGRMTLVGGQLVDLSAVTFQDGVPSRIEDAYRRTANTCKGWIELLRDTALVAGNEHLDGGATQFIDTTWISADGASFTGDVLDLYQAVYDGSPQELTDAITEGGVGGFGDSFWTIFAVSPSVFRKVYQDWVDQKSTPLQNEPRITRQPFQINTERGTRTIHVFFIDDTVVIPISEISQFDRYVTGTSHFAYLMVSGVIQLGGSFASIPVANESDIAIMIQQSQNVEDLGTFKFLSHQLMATAINDTKYIAGEYVFAEPA